MNAAELVKVLAKKLQLSQSEVSKRIDDTIAIIAGELTAGNSVSFSSLGTLETKKRDERISVNPATGQRMLVPPRIVAKFKPANGVKERLKNMEA
ncbi:MAG: HU family DNA-binding protein [Candidatus Symbiothrix sp.]|nr:HU family DNA-binding protein [Candidatus Symbiothrix sp.]